MRYLYFKKYSTYPDFHTVRTKILGEEFKISKLSLRRDYYSVLFIFKIFNGLTDVIDLTNRLQLRVPRICARSHEWFFVPKANTVQYANSPLLRMLKLANTLLESPQIDLAMNFTPFKKVAMDLLHRIP